MERTLGIYGWNNKGDNKQDDDILYGFKRDPNKALQHLTALEIQKKISADVYKSYFKVAIVRNPYDRAVSEYFWQQRFKLSFKDFLKKNVRRQYKKNKHYMEQYKFITDAKGNVIVDFVGRFEKLDEVLNLLSKRAGVTKEERPMHKVKPADFSHYSDYYDEESKSLVADIYRHDLNLFSYDFQRK